MSVLKTIAGRNPVKCVLRNNDHAVLMGIQFLKRFTVKDGL